MCQYPQQNGIAERKNRRLLEVARTLLCFNPMFQNIFGEKPYSQPLSSSIVCPLESLVFSSQSMCSLKSFHIIILFFIFPLRVFGCTSFVHVHSQNITKLDLGALKTFFLGYSPTQKGYKCYDPLTRKMYVSYDVSLFENQPYFYKTSI